MTHRPVTVAALVAAACGAGSDGSGTLTGAVYRSADTIRLAAPATAEHCLGSGDVLLEGTTPDGGGVLVWLRSGDSLAGEYPYLSRGDTLSPRGAIAGVRYVVGDIARGVTLDSGATLVSMRRERIGARVAGSGLDPTTAARIRVELEFAAVPSPRDSTACRAAL